MEKLTFGSLFAGIGGMDLGLERAGMVCRWQVEIDPFCQKVLAKHWPNVRRYGDIRTVDGSELERVDVIAGGFPCQDISYAGKGAGIDGERSGLWSEMLRIIRLVRPRFVLVENVPALLARGMGRVLGGLAESGYDAQWDSFPTGLHSGHCRTRLFIVANFVRPRLSGTRQRGTPANPPQRFFVESSAPGFLRAKPSPPMVRNVHGIPRRMDRIRGLGNAVYPACAEWIGHRIMEAYLWKN